MKLKFTYIFVIALVVLSSFTLAKNISKSVNYKLLTTENTFMVGNSVTLKFSSDGSSKPLLYCSNSYGSTLLSPVVKSNTLEFSLPESMRKKIGTVNWKLLNANSLTSGSLFISPKPEVATMETYIGPPSIEAGGTDYSMLVVIPTDSLDNPVPTNTLVNVKHQFLNSEEIEDVFTKNLIAYQNIYSDEKDGRILVSSESLGINSKEFTVNAMPAIPTSFTISVSRPHNYADGNQITTFNTSVIKDRFNNVVSDGTYVTFFITNQEGNILKTSGLTIEGVATSKIVHPDYSDTWRIKAYVDGMAESNTISVNYEQVIEDFQVEFSEKNRLVTVGPLQSFMKQMIPDGLQVKLYIYQENKLIDTTIKTSFNGYVNFNLKPAVYEKGKYSFKIETAGISKEFKHITLW